MADTPNLGLPEIEADQAQKHVAHNEALAILDALVQLSVKSRTLSEPIDSPDPEEGDRYIVPPVGFSPEAAGAFEGEEDSIAVLKDGDWSFITPGVGWVAYVQDEGVLVQWSGSAWEVFTPVVEDGSITDAKLRLSAALSVIGRALNSIGAPADIVAGTDGYVLRRSGTTLDFGQVATAGIANAAITLAKIQNIGSKEFLGRTTAGSGVTERLTVAQALAMLGIEVGTWTPALSFATVGTSTWGSVTASGWYVKIVALGAVLAFWNYTGTPTKGTGAGALQLGGFPYTIDTSHVNGGMVNQSNSRIAWGAAGTQLVLALSTSTIMLFRALASATNSEDVDAADITDAQPQVLRGLVWFRSTT